MKFLLKLLLNISSKYRLSNYNRRLNNCIANGLSLGKNVTIMPGAFIDPRYSFLISIGDNCSLSNGVIIVAHDAAPYKFTNGYTRLGKVIIKDNCYIGTNAIILPGVTIGPNVLIAAGSVVNKNIPPNSCVAGIPARVYSNFDDFIKNHKEMIKMKPSFDYKDFNLPSNEFKEKIKKILDEDQVYVKGFDGKFPWTYS
ncbi:acyltransferase [Clostridium sp.]|uniref:acyltransferase n=1 Tax=Clostridium sp. TaxID=1506 RepID=UPI00284E8F3E|nr:acyltransferase [Clostridium sp.]MDR3598828.1 acyltransferase [Clostridium sp.]